MKGIKEPCESISMEVTVHSNSTTRTKRLTAFYQKHNPGKLVTIDDTLRNYCDKENELFVKLEKR